MQSYQNLQAWKTGLDLVQAVYDLSKDFPSSERYELTKQLCKASISILLNLAEGAGRFTYPDKANKYVISRGECSEVEACILIAIYLGFTSKTKAENALKLVTRERKLLSGLINFCNEQIPQK
jgi:four helix bundle protein